jgi:hypothetical protein
LLARPFALRRSRLSFTASASNSRCSAISSERTAGNPAPDIPRDPFHMVRSPSASCTLESSFLSAFSRRTAIHSLRFGKNQRKTVKAQPKHVPIPNAPQLRAIQCQRLVMEDDYRTLCEVRTQPHFPCKQTKAPWGRQVTQTSLLRPERS